MLGNTLVRRLTLPHITRVVTTVVVVSSYCLSKSSWGYEHRAWGDEAVDEAVGRPARACWGRRSAQLGRRGEGAGGEKGGAGWKGRRAFCAPSAPPSIVPSRVVVG